MENNPAHVSGGAKLRELPGCRGEQGQPQLHPGQGLLRQVLWRAVQADVGPQGGLHQPGSQSPQAHPASLTLHCWPADQAL